MPAADPIAGDPVRLDTTRYRTRQSEAHHAHLGHPYTTEPTIQTFDMMRFHPDLPESFVYTGFTPRRAAVRSGEKVSHRLGEVPQGLLLHGLGASRQPVVLSTDLGQLSALLVVSGRAATRLPVLLLLDGQIPHIPGMATMLLQHHRLLSGGKQSVSRHTGNVAATTDKFLKGEAAFCAPAKAMANHAATTR